MIVHGLLNVAGGIYAVLSLRVHSALMRDHSAAGDLRLPVSYWED